MKARRGTALAGVNRDRNAYALARDYLLGFASFGVTDEVLQHYIKPEALGREGCTMAEVFHRLLLSARNRNMMAATALPTTLTSFSGWLAAAGSIATHRSVAKDELRPTGTVSFVRAGRHSAQWHNNQMEPARVN